MENILLKEAIIMANSNNMCRLCLSANGITEPICYDQRDQFLLQKIYECTTLQISPLNGIPSSLCTICKTRLDEFYQFRWQCIKNDEIIRRIADNFQKQPLESPASQNPKQEVIESLSSNDLQISPSEGTSEYSTPEEEKPEERHTPVSSYPPPEHTAQVRPEQTPNYNLGEHTHGPYGMGGHPTPNMTLPVGVEHPSVYPQDTKYPVAPAVAHQFEYTDFRRKRGRPPKQKYEQYHHPIVKYGENSIDGIKPQNAIDCSDSSRLANGPAAILSYGEGTSRSGAYPPPSEYAAWGHQPKIKLEQTDHHARYDEQHASPETHDSDREQFMKTESNSMVQTVLTPDGFVKRSRGRPPREGGCPNQDRTEYRFQCQYCDARFKAAINLKLHTNTHTGERPYKCQLCDKSFAHPSNLSVHTKLHTQERVKREGLPSDKKFQCPYCHTLFALAFQLKIHINTHTGQKPYVCKNCGKGFAQPSNLHVHVKKHCHKRVDYEPHRVMGPSMQPSMPVNNQHPPHPPGLPPPVVQQHFQSIQMHHHPLVLGPPASLHVQPTHSPEVSVANHHAPSAPPAEHPPPHHTEEHHSPSSTAQGHTMSMAPVMMV